MDTKYYLAVNNKQEGPYNLQQLRDMNLDANTLVWYDGLDEWKKLSNLPILSSQLTKTETPPPFDEEKYVIENNTVVPMPTQGVNQFGYININKKTKPNNYLAEAIFSLLFCCPIALIAVYKSLQVNKLYNKGLHDEAKHAAKQARNFALLAVAAGFIIPIISILLS